ncbi:MAG: CotH kinase family protein, partial [Bacteroidaceae bacterium]|nr:CotH kinase family protein [Bacteroidaceae bacterium]
MKKLLFALLLIATSTHAQTDDAGVVRYFTLTDGQLLAIPEQYILERNDDDAYIRLTLDGDTVVTLAKSHLATESTELHAALPEITSFKFNNKFNDQLFSDAIGVIDTEAGTINVDVPSIEKRLVASFQVSDGATVYVGDAQQHSKFTARRFTEPVTYTVAYPKNWVYSVRKISDEVWSQPDTYDPDEQWIFEPVALTEDMLSTNAPSNIGENPGNMLDGDYGTIFHSTWGNGEYTPLTWSNGSYYGDGYSVWPYLQIQPAEPIETFKFSYTLRPSDGYALLGFLIQGSHDGEEWFTIREFTQLEDNLPTGASQTYTSPVVTAGVAYEYLRLQLTASGRKNYLVLSEFSLINARENPDYGTEEFVPELLVPAQYARGFVPLGRDYEVNVRYLTDHSTSAYRVPTIRINTFDGTSITSKSYYWDATFEIEGAGIYPDMYLDSIQIRGRGNSSWGGGWSKEPYRMKFPTKQKPFGLTKGKSWVLLANKQGNSMTTNAMAMKIADMVGSAGCNHIVPVELYINGEYRGSYNFTEKVGLANNSISVDDEASAVLLELDQYYDEPYKFRDYSYSLPINIKEPEFDDAECVTNLDFSSIQAAFSGLTDEVMNGDREHYSTLLDVDAFCRYMLVVDLTRNTEVNHPKSTFCFNEDLLNDSAWVFGPVWDFDWSWGYEGTGQYYVHDADKDFFETLSYESGCHFFKALLRQSETLFKYRE